MITLHICQRSFYKIFVKFRNSKKNVLKIVLIIVNINKDENKSLIVYERLHVHVPFSIQSCRSCDATLHLCQRPFYKIFVKLRNSKKNVLKIVLIIVNINKDDN
jgi:hypothetical protein